MRKSVLLAGLIFAATVFVGAKATTHAEAAQVQPTEQQNIVEVKSGDSLSKIARNHETTYMRLFDANTFIQDPNIIYPGDKVRIPGKDEQLVSRSVSATQTTTESTPRPKPVQKKQTKSKPTPKKTQQLSQRVTTVVDGSVWDRLAACESGGRWNINTGNGYYGGLQFSAATWRAVGGSGLPHQASREEQINRGQILQARSGWGQWPACSAKLGLR